MDQRLSQLYDAPSGAGARRGSLGGSAPAVARWLGDIRKLFDSDVVRLLQRDAVDRLGIQRLLLEPELLRSVEPDVKLAATLLGLRDAIPDGSRAAVRSVVRAVTDRLREQLTPPLADAARGAATRRVPTRRPRAGELDPHATIRANLRRFEPSLGTIVPAELRGRRRARTAVKDLFLVVDQSASMLPSLLHACVCASVLAGLPSTQTRLVLFDTEVVDMTSHLGDDPVDLLFGLQLGGGTDIDRALTYVAAEVERPRDTVVVLVSDLFEAGSPDGVVGRLAGLLNAGADAVVLLALDDEGEPIHDEGLARSLAELGVPVLGCAPARFPEVIAPYLDGRRGTALSGRDRLEKR